MPVQPPQLTPEEIKARNRAISAGQKRAHARKRAELSAIRLVREFVPDLGADVKAIVVILEQEDGDER